MKTVMVVFGTRPEAIKMAPVVAGLKRQPEKFRTVVAVTAQHREMLDQVLELFAIEPDYDLDIMQHGQTLTDVTTRVLAGLEQVLAEAKPDVVLVHGDTTTTFASSLAAFYQQIPVGHVEAGLRTNTRYNPFPEEMNRRLTGTLATLHFAPTRRAWENLRRENVPEDNIYITGNTVIDALQMVVEEDYQFTDPALQQVDFSRTVLLVTTHRRENLGEPMRRIYQALREIVVEFSGVEVVFAVHRNPKVRRLAREMLGDMSRVHLIEPPAYREFANLMAASHLVLTDSGGLQEEAPSLGKPVMVLRETTERPEGIEAGTVLLAGTKTEDIVRYARRLLTDGDFYQQMARAANPYGDGQAAVRIGRALSHFFGNGARPQPFVRQGEKVPVNERGGTDSV